MGLSAILLSWIVGPGIIEMHATLSDSMHSSINLITQYGPLLVCLCSHSCLYWNMHTGRRTLIIITIAGDTRTLTVHNSDCLTISLAPSLVSHVHTSLNSPLMTCLVAIEATVRINVRRWGMFDELLWLRHVWWAVMIGVMLVWQVHLLWVAFKDQSHKPCLSS